MNHLDHIRKENHILNKQLPRAVAAAVWLLQSCRVFYSPWTIAHQVSLSWDFPGKNGVGWHFFLRGSSTTQGLNSHYACRQDYINNLSRREAHESVVACSLSLTLPFLNFSTPELHLLGHNVKRKTSGRPGGPVDKIPPAKAGDTGWQEASTPGAATKPPQLLSPHSWAAGHSCVTQCATTVSPHSRARTRQQREATAMRSLCHLQQRKPTQQ